MTTTSHRFLRFLRRRRGSERSATDRARRKVARGAMQSVEIKGYMALGIGLPTLGVAAGGSWTLVACIMALVILPAACIAAVPPARRWTATRVQYVTMLSSLARSRDDRGLDQSAATVTSPANFISRAATLARLARATAARIASRVLTRVGVVHVCVHPSHVATAQGVAAYN